MQRTTAILAAMAAAIFLVVAPSARAADGKLSHPLMRPLPAASERPLGKEPARFVDAVRGKDSNAGSKTSPWQTINQAVQEANPGEVIVLRGGTYYERVDVPQSGEEGKPITLRSHPGELAIIDGGLREFFEQPQTAWQPVESGANGEYVSAKTYPQFNERLILQVFAPNGWEPFYGIEDQRPVVLGQFADSMIPLHGYRTLNDLRDDSMIWDIDQKFDTEGGMYCGPGLWFNRETERIHVRLAPTKLPALGTRNYTGPTDTRTVPLIISGPYGGDVLRLNGVRHWVFQDLVLRGASSSPLINVYGADNLTFDGVTAYGGSPGMLINATTKLKLSNCAFRSLAAPWSSRASMKYRGTPSYAIITQRNKPQNQDFEFAYCEFTDGHDFAWVRDVKNLKFHHNYVDNFNDDGLEVGAKKRDHELYVSQNYFARCFLTFTLHEMEKDESPPDVDPNSGVYVTRNVIDLRHRVFNGPPRVGQPESKEIDQLVVLCSDHGGPAWPLYHFYHNTVLRQNQEWRGYYAFGMGARGLRNTKRWVFNNVFVQTDGLPGLNVPVHTGEILADGNLHWGVADGPAYKGDFFAKEGRKTAFKQSPRGEGWMAHDQLADPRFVKHEADPARAVDLRLGQNSPAIDSGVKIPENWFDPLRQEDNNQPDQGAFPAGSVAWGIGVQGRISIFGDGP